jgi:CheY-like chemotaxis protein
MKLFLVQEVFIVESATSGEQGLRAAQEIRPDLIILDVLMPGLDGWAVLEALKSAPYLADIPVIMLTIVVDKERALALGATDYLIKPIDRRRLVELLRQYRTAAYELDSSIYERRSYEMPGDGRQ